MRLADYSPWGHKKLDLATKQQQQPQTKHTNTFQIDYIYIYIYKYKEKQNCVLEDKAQRNIFKTLEQELFFNQDLKSDSHSGKYKKLNYIMNKNFCLPNSFYD